MRLNSHYLWGDLGMKMIKFRALSLVLGSVMIIAAGAAAAQDPVDDQADVWSTVERQWNAQEKGDKKWVDTLLTEDFSGWGKESPAPRGKASTKMWNRFAAQISEMVAHELYPLSINVNGDVAIAHYLYTSGTKDKDGDIETSNGRYTDVLVRTEDGWKFIAWHGGPDDE